MYVQVLRKMLPKVRHKSGHRLAVKRFEDQHMGGFIMVDSEKWSLVDKNGFAQAVSALFFSCHAPVYCSSCSLLLVAASFCEPKVASPYVQSKDQKGWSQVFAPPRYVVCFY